MVNRLPFACSNQVGGILFISMYPVITKENFEEMTDKLVYRRKYFHGFWPGEKRYEKDFSLRVKLPETRQEFFDMTKNMFGVGLGVSGDTGRYRIEATEDKYSELEIPKLWNKKYGQYDGLKVFLEFVFNGLSCGGVAETHYGQFNLKGYRHKLRLEKFFRSEFVPSEKIAIE